ncbi:MAG: translesion error-prone DNA polymerase V autoproteolytic subunit [Chlamydiae bacterium]|nr:translesion error-prone DNA polymerase V autoproteolytic subunit [Chlamydiota bacterium]
MQDTENIPLYETGVKAGFPSPAEEEMGSPLNLTTHLIPHPSSTFFIRVVGDSMQGAGIFSGDLLIVDKSLQPSHGKIVVALLNGEFTVKRLLIHKESVTLQAENPAYPPIHVKSSYDFSVWGVVTYVIHKPE